MTKPKAVTGEGTTAPRKHSVRTIKGLAPLWEQPTSVRKGHEGNAPRVIERLAEALQQIEKHLDPEGFCDAKAVDYAFKWARAALDEYAKASFLAELESE
jgi:hypothetical protein